MQNNRKKVLLSVALVFALVTIVLLIAWTTDPPFYHFAEWRLITLYSFFQLLATAYLSFFVCRSLEKNSSLKWQKNPSARPFFISAMGFLYLGFDEILSLHENIDKFIHIILRIKETAWTDHIDDFIVLVYGLIAIFFIKDFLREFRKHPYMIGLIVGGFILFLAMFCLDFMTNNFETFTYFFRDLRGMPSVGKHTQNIVRMVEDSVKLLGEAFFLAAFTAAFVDIKIKESSEKVEK